MEKYDVAIAGGGILGTCLAYWLSNLYEGRIALVEMEKDVAHHTSGRNTGVIHRPFYLHPEKRKNFAKYAQISYGLWKTYCHAENLPWQEVGTLEVATDNHQMEHIKRYRDWAKQNGMMESEVTLLNSDEVKKLEPHVDCLGALFAKTDTSVNYQFMTRSLKKRAQACGVEFRLESKIKSVRTRGELVEMTSTHGDLAQARFFINCSGGNAIDIAHHMGVGLDYTDLHFRGEYWQVSDAKSKMVSRNIYTVPKHPDIPFLDPHWIVRADGRCEIGPNAVLVAGSQAYEGLASGLGEFFCKIFERPIRNKVKLFLNPDFLKLASEEWRSSISKSAMLARVQKFIPNLKLEDLVKKGTAGIRSSVIDEEGRFVKEAIEIPGPSSFHILNYNSPGATGAPGYTAALVLKLDSLGVLSPLIKRSRAAQDIWDFEKVRQSLN